jgi:lysophospholipase L1-like esterase
MTLFKRVTAALFCSAIVPSLCFSQTSPPATDPPQTPATPQPVETSSPRRFGRGGPPVPAYEPSPRTDRNSQLAHEQLLEKSKQGGIDIYFEGDSIARRWGTSDAQYKDFLANWNENFFGWNAADFGWGADTIQNILWRLNNGELDGVNPKIIVVLAGTNNVGRQRGNDAKVQEISRGLKAIIDICQNKAPNATIIMTAIFPRNDNMEVMATIKEINANLEKLCDGKKVRYLNVNDKLADPDGKLFDGMMNVADKLHPTVKGYQVWADGLKPIFAELLGPPAKTDHAPAPTGDPSAVRKPASVAPAESAPAGK